MAFHSLASGCVSTNLLEPSGLSSGGERAGRCHRHPVRRPCRRNQSAGRLTPDETAALGNALLFDPANLPDNRPAKPLRLPGLNDPSKFGVSHTGKPDGSSKLVLTQPLASEWNAKVGADLNLAAAPPDGYRLIKPLPAASADQDSGAAWPRSARPISPLWTRVPAPTAIRASSALRSSIRSRSVAISQ